MFKHITKWSARVEKIEDIPEVMAKAFHIARSGRPGPVHVELPRETDESEYILQKEKVVAPVYKRIQTVVHQPEANDVARFAQRLKNAKAPVIAAGKGVIRQGALKELMSLAEKLQAPVVNAQDAIGVMPESHPLYAGFFKTGRSHPLCADAMKEADLVIGIGLRAGAAEMTELNTVAPKNMILIGFDDVAESRYRGDDQRVADPKLFLTALLGELGSFQKPHNAAILNRMAEKKAASRAGLIKLNDAHRGDQPIYPGLVMEAMNKVLDDRAVVASDVGNCQMWARIYRRIATPESFMQSGVWNAMSYALPTAIVAKMEFPERDVVSLAGDGAFLMTIGDLPTAAEYGANIMMVVHNNGTFGQTFMQQTSIYGHTFGTTFHSPNFADIAKACGCEGIRVSDPKDIEPALRQAQAATKRQPALVEVMVADVPNPKIP
jgi:acetolactate synthase-1/2/3 large subunit